jgi:2-methylcitrate dehydratase PrpD
LTGIREPGSGLEGKWSLYHSAAVTLCDGAAGERQYTDDRVRDPVVARLRARVTAEPDATLCEDGARVAILLQDGRRIERRIEHAIGSTDNPMSDRDLEGKFRALAADALPPDRIEALIATCWAVARLDDVADVMRLAVRDAIS